MASGYVVKASMPLKRAGGKHGRGGDCTGFVRAKIIYQL